MNSTSWIGTELNGADFGDTRLNNRLLKIADNFMRMPSLSINDGHASWAEAKAAYRFFENEKTNASEIFSCHQSMTIQRMTRTEGPILAIQDTTYIDYSSFSSIQDLGVNHHNPKMDYSKPKMGLAIHSTLAVTGEGLPLGFLHQSIGKKNKCKKKGGHKDVPIEKKDSYKWIKPILKSEELLSEEQRKRIVHVCDREADVFEFFFVAHEANTRFLIRAGKDRVVGPVRANRARWESTTLWELMETIAESGRIKITIPARQKLKKREAICEVRYLKTTYTPPQRSLKAKSMDLKPVDVYAIWIIERDPPKNREALEWMLITNIPVNTLEDALEKVKWYRSRWQIETFHKILKSGCKVEDCRLNHREKLEKYLVLKSIIAFRIYWMTWLARTNGEMDCRVILAEHEWKALYCLKNKERIPPAKSPTVNEVIKWIASLGGFLGRKSDGNPGPKVIWKGWQRLEGAAEMWLLLHSEDKLTATYG